MPVLDWLANYSDGNGSPAGGALGRDEAGLRNDSRHSANRKPNRPTSGTEFYFPVRREVLFEPLLQDLE
jgi:hypothetical protein